VLCSPVNLVLSQNNNISLRVLRKSARRRTCALERAWCCFRHKYIDHILDREHECTLLRLPRTMAVHFHMGWRRTIVVYDVTMNLKYFVHIFHAPFGVIGWIGHWLVASLSGSSPFYILGRILGPHPVAISDMMETLRKLLNCIILVNSGDEAPCLIKFAMRNDLSVSILPSWCCGGHRCSCLK
jgi:hypothetical protein